MRYSQRDLVKNIERRDYEEKEGKKRSCRRTIKREREAIIYERSSYAGKWK